MRVQIVIKLYGRRVTKVLYNIHTNKAYVCYRLKLLNFLKHVPNSASLYTDLDMLHTDVSQDIYDAHTHDGKPAKAGPYDILQFHIVCPSNDFIIANMLCVYTDVQSQMVVLWWTLLNYDFCIIILLNVRRDIRVAFYQV